MGRFYPPGHQVRQYMDRLGITDADLVYEEDDNSPVGVLHAKLGPDGSTIRTDPVTGEHVVLTPRPGEPSLLLRKRYWVARERILLNGFNGLKTALTDPRSTFNWRDVDLGPSTGDPIEDLTNLRDLVMLCRRALNKIDMLLEFTPEGDARARRAAAERARIEADETRRLEVAAAAREITLE